MVFTGYALGVLSKPFFALATCMPVVFAARFFDRIGKGIRGAPRDAIVAEVTAESVRGAAYGLRQSLDAAGAFIGPALATILLMFFTENYRIIFWLALIPGLCCLALILFGVENVETEKKPVKEPIEFKTFFLQISSAFKCLLVIGVVFSLARFSNAFMILIAADSGVPAALVPLIFVGSNLVFAASSYPLGKLADRIPSSKLLALGLLFLIASDCVFALWQTPYAVAVGVALFGLHLGASQGIFSMMVAKLAPAAFKATAFGVFNFLCGLATLVAGLLAGFSLEGRGQSYPPGRSDGGQRCPFQCHRGCVGVYYDSQRLAGEVSARVAGAGHQRSQQVGQIVVGGHCSDSAGQA